MSSFLQDVRNQRIARGLYLLACALALISVQTVRGQEVPLISGGAGFVTSTNGGNTTYLPVVSPVLGAPIGSHVFVESRATILQAFFPKSGKGYDHDAFLGLDYLQADITANRHLTVVAGQFLTPFATYNERLTPIWISNFESAPLIYSLGTMQTAHSVGGMLRGSAASNAHFNLDYAAYFSAASTNEQFNAQRSSGGRASVYLPAAHLEIGASYNRLLQDKHENFSGVHLWWEPADSSFRLRSEFATGEHARGYWVEAGYRLHRFGGDHNLLAGFEPLFRMQQTFRSSPDPNDGLPAHDTQQPDFGLDYHLPHEVRINTSYSRQFSSAGNRNIWQTGIIYRFLFPTWRSK
ncbi:hypothetical protein [Occallatibacter riparius]|uniref:Uncharacterized protein n=1 Tax=Occallatibacter riparius TaxID=1002689 RepID=A0A9J7BMX1_9BACT|nr:hypothetical protein [Occallatibacter riparius]UWZ82262.1 hypothetical protein MOP44_16965 [Occallatibacter riparius]